MGRKHLDQASITKRVLQIGGIVFLAGTVVGLAFATLNEEGTFDFDLFLKWEVFVLVMLAVWILLRYANRLFYGEDGDTDEDW